MSSSVSKDGQAAASSGIARDFLTFINSSPSHFHAVATAASMLSDAGFSLLRERDDWSDKLQPGGAYFYTRNQSSLVAFVLPESYSPARDAASASASSVGSPFFILAAHTDSPVLKVKPVSKVAKHGCLQVGVECYGGGLWHTWFDRDLSVAGRVVVKKEGGGADGQEQFETRLVRVERPVLRIPNLAIHLNREVNEKGFLFNKQTHLLPVLATSIQQQLNSPASEQSASSPSAAAGSASAYTPPSLLADHHTVLLELLSSSLSVPVSSIVDLELSLYDTQPACLGGAYSEFVFSRALDNLMMSFISLRALLDHRKAQTGSSQRSKGDGSDGQAGGSGSGSGSGSGVVNVVALFDNEEVGSESYQGAGASLLSFLQRVHSRPACFDACMRRSLLVSADMAHAVHPNYAEAHEEQHRPLLHGGLVIKQNANQRYATSTLTSHGLRLIASRHGIPVQRFVVRNDSACGSTIGPILSANTGVRTVDVGVAQWAMHSIRECCGVGDIDSAHRLFLAALTEYEQADAAMLVEGE